MRTMANFSIGIFFRKYSSTFCTEK